MSTVYRSAGVSDGYNKRSMTGFGGYDHRLGASDGAIFDMKNMCGEYYPLASPRPQRAISRVLAKPNGIAGYDGLYYVDGVGFYDASVSTTEPQGNVTNTKKRFAFLGKKLVILPDKAYYDTSTHEFGSLEAVWSGTVSFSDGEYAGEEAEACRIVTTDAAFTFNVGDAVTIEGADDEENNTTLIIREISKDKKSLGFYEHSFTVAKSQTVTISRKVPDMDFICENENRLFGCKGDTVYASKLGDPFNWNVFDGLASDSFSVDVGSAGDFTACTSYGGYAVFFKEDRVYKLYGDKPTNFQLMSSASLGVVEGSSESVAVAGEALYYLSKVGVMVYTGGIPSCISYVFGDVSYCDAVGGSDGLRYYVSMRESGTDKYTLMSYDTRYREWYKEDETKAVGFCYYDGLRMLAQDGTLYRIGPYKNAEDGQTAEPAFESMIEFYDITESMTDRKHVNSVQLRLMLDSGATVKIYMSFDGGEYQEVDSISGDGKASYYVPCRLHRCDYYRIKLTGTGKWKLCAMTREYSKGSEI